jgi:hypothetical protein
MKVKAQGDTTCSDARHAETELEYRCRVMARQRYIDLERKFSHIGDCPFCGGIVFYFDVETLNLYDSVSPALIRKIRKMVREGASLEQLLDEFPDNLIIDEFECSICEKCGHEDCWPKHGGR